MKLLTISKKQEICDKIYFNFEENDYSVIYHTNSGRLKCNCHNGSNVGVNNSQLCVHKILVRMNVGCGIKQIDRDNVDFKNYQKIINQELKKKNEASKNNI